MLLVVIFIVGTCFQVFSCFPQSLAVGQNDEIVANFAHVASHIYGQPDKKIGTQVSSWTQKQNPMEAVGSYFEGDILIPREHGRNGISDFSYKWKNGTIPYVISDDFDDWDQYLIRKAFHEIELKTCIRFVPRSNLHHPDYLFIQNTLTGCWSSVGRVGGRQELNIQSPGCNMHGTIVHELLHAIGFWHEQSREDRDNYIQIQWDNVQSGMEFNFGKADLGSTSTYGVPYDYQSILHYSPYSFSKNGRTTILATQRGADKMGQRIRLSKRDILKVNRLYDCKRRMLSSDKAMNNNDIMLSSNEVK